jgi:hypothetical protein
MRIRWVSLFYLLSIALAGCRASQGKAGDAPSLSPLAPKETESLLTSSPAAPKEWDDMPKDPPLPFAADPGLPALIERAKVDLAQKLSIPASQIKAIETKEVFWPDGSLGCPQPGIAYAQIPTPGYLIMLVYSGNEFEYHADTHGNTLYCENPTPPISGTPVDIDPLRTAPP